MDDQVGKLLKDVREHFIRNFGVEYAELFDHAYALAAYCHDGQKRRSGEDYITHCLSVAKILIVEGASPTVVCAGLLHDVLDAEEGAPLLRGEMPRKVADLAEGAFALDGKDDSVSLQSLGEDTLFIKVADRLHNCRTWDYTPLSRVEVKAHQSLEVHAVLARRLNLAGMGGEFKRRSEFRIQQVAAERDKGTAAELLELSTAQLAALRRGDVRENMVPR